MAFSNWFKKKPQPSAPAPKTPETSPLPTPTPSSPSTPTPDPQQVWLGLRDLIFNADPHSFGLAPDSPLAYAFLIEQTHLPQNVTTTIVALLDGTLSLYLSDGGGVLGAGQRSPQLTDYVKGLVSTAHQFTPILQKTSTHPAPPPGYIHFHIITPQGDFTATTTDTEMRTNQTHSLFPLYAASQNLLTQIRLATEKSLPSNPTS